LSLARRDGTSPPNFVLPAQCQFHRQSSGFSQSHHKHRKQTEDMQRIIHLMQTDPTMTLMAMEFGVAGVVTACAGLLWHRLSRAVVR
jgi:hypothetical protein